MKIAIIIGGQPRFNEQTILKFNENIINELQIHDVEIFISTKPIFIERWKNFYSSVPIHINISPYTEYNDSNFFTAQTIERKKHYNQLHNLLGVINSTKFFQPDILLKARTDFIYTNKINNIILDDALHVADWEVQNLRRYTTQLGFISDQVYYGKSALVKKIIEGIMFDKEYGYDINHGLEKQLYLFTSFYNIEVKNFDFEFLHARDLYHEFENDLELLPEHY